MRKATSEPEREPGLHLKNNLRERRAQPPKQRPETGNSLREQQQRRPEEETPKTRLEARRTLRSTKICCQKRYRADLVKNLPQFLLPGLGLFDSNLNPTDKKPQQLPTD